MYPRQMIRQERLFIVTCGQVDSGKCTTDGRLLFEVGGVPEREKSTSTFAFYMDRHKEERNRGVIIAFDTERVFR